MIFRIFKIIFILRHYPFILFPKDIIDRFTSVLTKKCFGSSPLSSTHLPLRYPLQWNSKYHEQSLMHSNRALHAQCTYCICTYSRECYAALVFVFAIYRGSNKRFIDNHLINTHIYISKGWDNQTVVRSDNWGWQNVSTAFIFDICNTRTPKKPFVIPLFVLYLLTFVVSIPIVQYLLQWLGKQKDLYQYIKGEVIWTFEDADLHLLLIAKLNFKTRLIFFFILGTKSKTVK